MAQTTETTGMDQPEKGRPDRSRLLWAIILAVGWLAGVAWRLWLARDLTAPSIRGDEDSYLLAARALTTGIGGETTENALFRRTGYPLLLAPFYHLTSNPADIYRLAQLLNAMINALLLPLAYAAGRRVFRWDRPLSLLAALAASTLPAAAFYSGLAMTDAVLATVVFAWLLACHAMLRRPASTGVALLAGGLAGLAYLLHVRGIVIVALQVLLVAAALTRAGVKPTGSVRATLGPSAASLAAVGAFVLLNAYAVHRLGSTMVLAGDDPETSAHRAITGTDGALRILMSATGQLWYLAVCGFAITAIGMLTVPRWLRAGPDRDWATGTTMLLALLATIGIAVLSSAVLEGLAVRVNFLAYPRYVQVLEPWWLLTGLAALARATRRRLLVPAAAALAILGVGLLIQYRMDHGASGGFNAFDSPELAVISDGWTRLRPLPATAVALAGLILVLGVVTVARHRHGAVRWLAGAVTAVNLVVVPVAVQRVSVPMMNDTASRPPLAALGVRPGDIVAVDSRTFWWQWRNAEREITWTRIERFDHQQGPPPGATVALAYYAPGNPDSWDGTAYGWHLVSYTDDGRGIWRRD